MRVRALGVALAAIALATPAGSRSAAQQATVVRGSVAIDIPIATRRASAAYPSRAVTAVNLAPASEVRNVVVFLKDAPGRPVTPTRAEIRQRDETFLPRVVAVPVGSEVTFPNDDPFYHNVFSLSRAKTFNLGRYPRGQTRTIRFDRPGIVRVFCDIHSHMTATVMVFNHPWFAVPDADGHFELPEVPPGDRQITAWHERLGDTTLPIHVESGHPVSMEFVLPVPAQ
jgi:plastocyanin